GWVSAALKHTTPKCSLNEGRTVCCATKFQSCGLCLRESTTSAKSSANFDGSLRFCASALNTEASRARTSDLATGSSNTGLHSNGSLNSDGRLTFSVNVSKRLKTGFSRGRSSGY